MRPLAAIAVLLPATAHAEPAVDLSRCDLFDRATATRAIAAELADPADLEVTIDCPDPLTARVSIGALTRHLDLGEVSAGQRLRLLALAVAELAEAAVTDPVPAPATDPAPVAVAAADPEQPFVLSPSTRSLRDLAQDKPSRRTARSPRADVRLGTRVFLSDPTPLVDLSLGASRDRLAADLFVATRRASDPLGTLRGTVAGAGIAVSVACRDHLCASARGAAGIATVTADPAATTVAADDRATLYLEAGPRLEARVHRRDFSAALTIDAGWSWGLVGLAADREVLQLSGPVVTASLGIGWGP